PKRTKGSEESASLVVGVYRRTGGGRGYVRLLNGTQPRQEIYIAPRAAKDASTGDTVEVRVGRARRRGAQLVPVGEVVRVLERATSQFVGTYYQLAGQPLVQVDGNVFGEPIVVDDPQAKGLRTGD